MKKLRTELFFFDYTGSFTNMTGKLYPKGPEGRQDDYTNQLYRQEDYLKKLSKEIFGEHETKIKKRK